MNDIGRWKLVPLAGLGHGSVAKNTVVREWGQFLLFLRLLGANRANQANPAKDAKLPCVASHRVACRDRVFECTRGLPRLM